VTLTLGYVCALHHELKLELVMGLKCPIHGGLIRAEVSYAGPRHLKRWLAHELRLCPSCLTACCQALTERGFDTLCRADDGDLTVECERVRPGAAQGATWESI
jgi:hypothetical protein